MSSQRGRQPPESYHPKARHVKTDSMESVLLGDSNADNDSDWDKLDHNSDKEMSPFEDVRPYETGKWPRHWPTPHTWRSPAMEGMYPGGAVTSDIGKSVTKRSSQQVETGAGKQHASSNGEKKEERTSTSAQEGRLGRGFDGKTDDKQAKEQDMAAKKHGEPGKEKPRALIDLPLEYSVEQYDRYRRESEKRMEMVEDERRKASGAGSLRMKE